MATQLSIVLGITVVADLVSGQALLNVPSGIRQQQLAKVAGECTFNITQTPFSITGSCTITEGDPIVIYAAGGGETHDLAGNLYVLGGNACPAFNPVYTLPSTNCDPQRFSGKMLKMRSDLTFSEFASIGNPLPVCTQLSPTVVSTGSRSIGGFSFNQAENAFYISLQESTLSQTYSSPVSCAQLTSNSNLPLTEHSRTMITIVKLTGFSKPKGSDQEKSD